MDIDHVSKLPILNSAQAAFYLGVCKRKFLQDVRARRFSHIRIGGKLLFRREALDAELRRMEVQAVA
jgi:excisionase family DNA binding protein